MKLEYCGTKWEMFTEAVIPLAKVSAIMPEKATRNCTCLGHLGRHDKKRNNLIHVVSPKVAKANTRVTVPCHCHKHYRLKNIANLP
jgi:hypothetical protein